MLSGVIDAVLNFILPDGDDRERLSDSISSFPISPQTSTPPSATRMKRGVYTQSQPKNSIENLPAPPPSTKMIMDVYAQSYTTSSSITQHRSSIENIQKQIESERRRIREGQVEDILFFINVQKKLVSIQSTLNKLVVFNQKAEEDKQTLLKIISTLLDTLYIELLRSKETEIYREIKTVLSGADLNTCALQSFAYAHAIFLDPTLARQIDLSQLMSKLDDYISRGLNQDAGKHLIAYVVNELVRRLNTDECVPEYHQNQAKIFDDMVAFLNKHQLDTSPLLKAKERQLERKNVAFLKIYMALHKAQDGSAGDYYLDKRAMSPEELAKSIEAHAKASNKTSRTNVALHLCNTYLYNGGCNEKNVSLINAMYAYVWDRSKSSLRVVVSTISSIFANPPQELKTADEIKKLQENDKYLKTIVETMMLNGPRAALFGQIEKHEPIKLIV